MKTTKRKAKSTKKSTKLAAKLAKAKAKLAKLAKLAKVKEIVVNFDGGKLTSDAGVLLLQRVNRILKFTERINRIIADPRDPLYITHQQEDLIIQRVIAIALGYEDVNDHNTLRKDPALLAIIKNHLDEEKPLGSAPTLSRLENRITSKELTDLSKLFVELFIESHVEPPKQIIIDVDATDDPIHGNQEGRYFNGFYDEYCFLPLYFFCGDQLLWAQLRTSERGGAYGVRAIMWYIAKRLREVWPDVEIVLRGDAGFGVARVINYCDRYGLKYILGVASNKVLERLSENIVLATKMFFKDAGSKEALRLFGDIEYQAGTWKKPHRVVVKAERLPDEDNLQGRENTRYIVTNLEGSPTELYEDTYCARGEMENRIKEQQLMLFADRTSCHDFLANRFRLFLSSCAYVLMETLRRTALCDTELAQAQCDTIRLKLFKIAAVVRQSVRRIEFSLSSVFPYRELWRRVYDRLRMAGDSLVFDHLRMAGRVPAD